MIVLDRIEGLTAVLEIDGERKEVGASEISSDAREGDILIFTERGYEPDKSATLKRRNRILELQKKLHK